jgi:N-acetylmuramoyl-L-alanine amidase
MAQQAQQQMEENRKVLEPQIKCLAKNIYFEARGEPYEGKLAVAIVTINRLNHPAFPGTICDVVYDKNQFSWTRVKNRKITDMESWNVSYDIATNMVYGYIKDIPISLEKAIYFHATYITPGWKMRRVAKIGNHIFYA